MEQDLKKGDRKEVQTRVIGGIKIVEAIYEIDKPHFKDVEIEKPIFKDKQIEVPVGFEEFALKSGEMIANVALDHIISTLESRLAKAIDKRVKEIEVPKIIVREEIKVITREVVADKVVLKDVPVAHAVVKNVEVINSVIKDVPVTNSIITDFPVKHAIITDKEVTNAIVTDKHVTNAIIKDKTVEAIHPKYINLEGKPE